MVTQYPYRLEVNRSALPLNSEGHPVETEPVFKDLSSCRDEMNNSGKTVTNADGQAQVYDYLILLPKSCPDVVPNETVRVTNGAQIRLVGTVKRFSRDQMHCRLWV